MTTATTDQITPQWPPDRPRPAGDWLEVDRCLEELARLAQTEILAQEFYAALADRAQRLLPAVGSVVRRLHAAGIDLIHQQHFPQPLLTSQRAVALRAGSRELRQPLLLPPHARSSVACPVDNPHPWPVVICPLACDDDGDVLLEIALEPAAGAEVQRGAAQLIGVFGEIAGDFHRRRELERLRGRESRLAQYASLVSRFHAQLDVLATAYTIANDGRQWIGCDRVSVLRLRRGSATALAVSAVDRLDRRSREIVELERLAAAVAASGDSLQWDGADADRQPPQLASLLEAYLDSGHARQVVVCLLRPAGTDIRARESAAIGVLVAESFVSDQPLSVLNSRTEEVARAGSAALANALAHYMLPLRSLLERLSNAVERVTQRPVAAALGLAALVAAIALLTFVPADFSVPAEGTVQPQVRRHLFAPADGVVSEVQVEHGAVVAQGDLLLRIRNPGLELEHSRLTGELQTAEAKLAAVRSTRSRPEESPKTGDQDRLASEEEQLKQQVQGLVSQLTVMEKLRSELNVVSPLDGVVLTWNTRQLLADRPVKQGQVLLTVADPSGPWELELRVPDAEVGHVVAGQRSSSAPLPVTFLLVSDPTLTQRGSLASLALATDAADGKSAAEATAAIAAPLPAGARAGSQALARIYCGRRSVGYVWLHDLIDTVRTSVLF